MSGVDSGTTPRPRLAIGGAAPEFALCDQHGQLIRLSDFSGHTAALVVFYPFAFSRICTGELTAIRNELPAFTAARVQVLAVSCDPMFALRAWSEQERFEFPLLSDFWPHGAAAQAYGVFDPERGSAGRGSFLVDSAGRLQWSVVSPPGEARDLAAYRTAIDGLSSAV